MGPTASSAPSVPERAILDTGSSVLAAAVIAWLGLLVHNVADLPDQTLVNPETHWPSLVTGASVVVYATGPARAAGIGLLIWALLNLVGGALSVLPLPALRDALRCSWGQVTPPRCRNRRGHGAC